MEGWMLLVELREALRKSVMGAATARTLLDEAQKGLLTGALSNGNRCDRIALAEFIRRAIAELDEPMWRRGAMGPCTRCRHPWSHHGCEYDGCWTHCTSCEGGQFCEGYVSHDRT